MKKFFAFIICLFVFTSASFAEILNDRFKLTESPKEFDVTYYMSDVMVHPDQWATLDIDSTEVFYFPSYDAELRYTLFTDFGDDDYDDWALQAGMLTYTLFTTIVGHDLTDDDLSLYEPEDVAAEFNGDAGGCAIFVGPNSDYTKGYLYAYVDFFVREGQGYVLRTFLFNDLSFIGINPEDGSMEDYDNSPFAIHYHSFNFMDQDENGNFIQS